MVSIRQRGIMFLAFGVFFTSVFLIGGGVLTSTNGGYWTSLFGLGVVSGLALIGPWVYWSARANCTKCSTEFPSAARFIGSAVFVGLTMFLSSVFFQTELFRTNFVQHAFLIVMGLCVAQFIPLGLGFLKGDAEQSHLGAIDRTNKGENV